ncbi:hypothetical protein CEQ90_11685 [Lewinellaceae bacterium SD302]|nr:hypothetical protein CEQ90_11685 [Lewinellaceae bacterium SD302]
MSTAKNEADFLRTMRAHLDAVSNKDLTGLKATLSPDNKMQLILPGEEIMMTADSFLAFHQSWFQDENWTMETEILNTEIGHEKGIAVTQLIYREPERDGVPYFNRMIVTYGLEKQDDNKWYVIMDHASSSEKSTD